MADKPQKTLEDYRNIIKLLKLKVLKLQKKNQELEQKLYEPFDDSYISGQSIQDINAAKIQQNWRNKNKVDSALQTEGILMQDLYKGCRKLGITPEGLFRAADKDGAKSIQIDEFKLFLKNVRLELTSGQTNRLASMADESCRGQVTEESWHMLLEMYEVAQEKRGQGERSFSQQALFQFANIFIQNKISPEEGFDQIAKGHSTITNDRFKSYCLNQDKNMTDKQSSSAFNHLDFNKKGRIIKECFIPEVRKAMRIIAQDQGLSISQFCPPQEKGIQKIDGQKSRPQDLEVPLQKRPSRNVQSPTQLNKSLEQSQLIAGHFQVKKVDQKQVVQKLKQEGVDIGLLFQNMLDDLVNPLAGIRIKDVYEAFNKTKKSTPKQLQLQFFQCLDKNGNGGADFNECLEFYCQYMDLNNKESWPLDLVFGMKNQHLKATLTYLDDYLDSFQITDHTIINPQTFQYQAKKMFNVHHHDTKQIMNVMGQISQTVQGEGKLKQKIRDGKISHKQRQEKKVKPKIQVDVSKFQQALIEERESNKKPYDLQPQDFFKKVKLEDDTSAQEIQTPWSTILNDEISCLIKCTEIVLDLKKRKLNKWTDDEFGPNDHDKVGASALYFCDNEIPDGAPQPEDVQWLRPEELLQLLRDMGETFYDIDENGKDIEKDYENKEPCFMEGGASSNDVKQSQYLGNCWFISALSIISQDDNLINGKFDADENTVKDISNREAKGMSYGVYPPMFHFLEQYGIYVIRFFKNAGWRYVIIDDRIPCKEGGEIIYGQCKQKNELWVPIIEKAYAKLHNCYQALIAGDIAQGLADMTGMIADKTKLEFPNAGPDSAKEADDLWEKLKKAKQDGTMMGCSAEGETEGFIFKEGENTGVLSGHAYSLLDVIELPFLKEEAATKTKNRGFHRLLRIRNPWGHGEWKFKWSDIADDYKEQTLKHKQDIDKYYENEKKLAAQWNKDHPDEDPKDLDDIETIELGADDGTFLMNFKEWRELYSNLFMCINFPDDWSGQRIIGQWTSELSAGAPKKGNFQEYAQKNPQYVFSIKRQKRNGIKDKRTTSVYINQTQRDGRLFWGEKYPYDRVTTFMLLCVFKLDAGERQLNEFDKKKMDKAGSSKNFILRREIDSDFMELEDGDYAIVSCTKNQGFTGYFALNIYFDCDKQDIQFRGTFDRQIELQEIKEEEEKIEEISKDMRIILKEVAQNELVMLKEREQKYGKSKTKKF